MQHINMSPDDIENLKRELKVRNLKESDASLLIKKASSYLSRCFNRGWIEENAYLDLVKIIKSSPKTTDPNKIKIDSVSLAEIVNDKGYTRTNLSECLGWGHSEVSKAITRGIMNKERAYQLADYLEVPLESFAIYKNKKELALVPSNFQNQKKVNVKNEECECLKKIIRDFIDDEISLLSNLESLIEGTAGKPYQREGRDDLSAV